MQKNSVKTYTVPIPEHMMKLADHEITCSQFLFHGMLKLRIISVDKKARTMDFSITPCESYTKAVHEMIGTLFEDFFDITACSFYKHEQRINKKKEDMIEQSIKNFQLEDD